VSDQENAMNHADMTVGMKVYFGRAHGERTLGEIVKINPAKVKVRQLESRGSIKGHPVGTVWTVPPFLCTPAEEGATASPAPTAAKAMPTYDEALRAVRYQMQYVSRAGDVTVSHADIAVILAALATAKAA
jgi:hypothetical protein